MRYAILLRLVVVLVLVGGIVGLGASPQTSATVGGNWTLTVRTLACPEDYGGATYAVDCTDVLPGVSFETYLVRSPAAKTSFVTGDDGTTTVDLIGPGLQRSINARVPAGYSSYTIDCTANGGETVDVQPVSNRLLVNAVDQDDAVACDCCFVPWQPRDATLTLHAFVCPPGMTADTLDPGTCVAISDGFDVSISSMTGLMTPYTLADATQDGMRFTWNLGNAPTPRPPSEFGQWAIHEAVFPAGYGSYVIVGDSVVSFRFSAYQLDVSGPRSQAEIALYIFSSMPPTGEAFALPINAVNCTSKPTGAFLREPTSECSPGVGIWFEASGPDGSVYGNCVTTLVANGLSGGCSILVPYGTTVTVTENEDTIPPGYSPEQNPNTIDIPTPPIEGEIGPLEAFVNLPLSSATATQAPTPGGTVLPNLVVGRPAHIHPGNCGKLRRQNSYDLTDLTVATGDWDGSRRATAAEESFSVIDVSLDDLLATSHAINVHDSAEAMGVYIVCGETGGVRRPDGSVAVGLREVNGSGFEGIAYLAPNADDPSKTNVWVFVAPKLAEEERSIAEPAASPEASTPVASPVAT